MTRAATHLSRSVPIWLYVAFGLVTTTAVVSIAMHVKQFGIAPAVDHDIWGQFGDFVGGILNPMVSFAALVLLARTYLLQRQEMADTSAALQNQARSFEAQRREARFFDLLRLYQDTLNQFVKLLRAQLSRDELVLIALNLLEGEGRKMRQLVAEYGLLKHLADGRLREGMRREFPLGTFRRKSDKLESIAL
jgi:hypothetical protein